MLSCQVAFSSYSVALITVIIKSGVCCLGYQVPEITPQEQSDIMCNIKTKPFLLGKETP